MKIKMSLLEDIVIGIQNVNSELFYSAKIKDFDMMSLLNEAKGQKCVGSFLHKASEWCDFVEAIISNRQQQANELDEKFVWLMDYITTYRKYKKIYCYEITPESVESIKKNLAEYENIQIVNIRDDYKFYLRSNGMQWAPAELVLFAL